MFKIPHLFLSITVLCVANSAGAASFDCTKAATKVEKLICNNKQVSALDDLLGEVYKDEVQRESRSADFKNSQRNWLTQRNECTGISCIEVKYDTRLVEIICDPKSLGAGSGIKSAQCTYYSLKIADRQLVQIEQQYSKKLSTDPSNPDYLVKSFKAESKAWLDYRVAQCRLYGANEGGLDSWKTAFALGCELKETEERISRLGKELKN